MQISVACFYLLAPLTPFSGHFRERFENKHCGFHVCIILNWIDLCGVTRQAPSVLAVMLFLHPRELRNIRTDRSLKGAVIDSLKLKQMFRPLLACQWLRTRCGMKNSPQKGKNEREWSPLDVLFAPLHFTAQLGKEYDVLAINPPRKAMLVDCGVPLGICWKLKPSVTYLAQIYQKKMQNELADCQAR